MAETSKPSAKIELHTLFSTPVAVAILPDTGPLNRALHATILTQEKSYPSTKHSNLGGWQPTGDIDEWGGEKIRNILTFTRQFADKLTVNRQGQPALQNWLMNAWANVSQLGHGNEFHTHPSRVLSACYYVGDGGITDDLSVGGQFKIQDPRGVAPAIFQPNLAPNVPNNAAFGAREIISPTAGTILTFPSWLSHAARPYTGGDVRISAAMNLS